MILWDICAVPLRRSLVAAGAVGLAVVQPMATRVAAQDRPAVALQGPAAGVTDPHAGHAISGSEQAPGTVAVPENVSLPPPEERSKAALDRSPRHGEWVDIPLAGGSVPLRTWVVYPEREDKAPVVIVIHEVYGLSDWIRAVADQFAREGFIAVAPDLLSGKGPGGGGTDSVESRDDVVKLVRTLTPAEVTARLDATRAYALKIPAASGTVGTVGFCWGGSTSFNYATAQPALDAAVVYYGSSPEAPLLAAVTAPVLGLYGGDDARVNATIDPAVAEMARLGKIYEPNIYDGAGHGFLRAQGGRDGANPKATQQAWPATLAFLRKYLR